MSAVHWHDFDRTHVRDTALRLAAAVVLILLVHALAAYALLFLRKVEAGDAAPPAAVMIELAPLAVSEEAQDETTPAPPMTFSPEQVPDAPDVPAEAAPPPEPLVEQVVEKMPDITPAPVEAEVVLPRVEPEKKKEEAKPRPKVVERPKTDATPTRRKQAPATAAPPRSDAPRAETTAAPSAGAAAARSAALADWRSRAFAHISRFKRPQNGHAGTPGISISLTAAGSVTGVRLVRSSGDEVLDREAVAMAQRASPFPAPPEGRAMSFGVAINFKR